MAKVLVKASGVKSSPSWPERAKMGRKETTTSASAKKMGRPTCCAAWMIVSKRSAGVSSRPRTSLLRRSFLCAFSIMTMLASIMAPMAMAMPPRLMMLLPMPNSFISRKVVPMTRGRMSSTISDERRCMRNSPMTATTMMLSSMRVLLRLPMALSINPERS